MSRQYIKKNTNQILKITVSCLFISFLAFKIDWNEIISSLKNVDLKLYLLSTFIAFLTIPVVASKYYLLLKNTSIDTSISKLIKYNIIGRFYSLFLPSGITQETVRWYKVTKNKQGRALFLAITVYDRSIFIFLMILAGTITLFFHSSNHEIITLRTYLLPVISLLLTVTAVIILYFSYPSLQLMVISLLKRFSVHHKIWGKLVILFEKFSLNKPLASFAFIFTFTILVLLLSFCRFFFMSQAFSLSLSFIDIVWISSLVTLLQSLPISVGGIGVREGALAYIFTLYKLPPEHGVIIGILLFSQFLFIAVIGGVMEWAEH